MLPGDTKQRREAATDTSHQTLQTTLANHFPPAEVIIPYSDRALEGAAIEWLIQTNQVRHSIPTSFFDVLIPSHSANPGIQESWLQEDVGHCVPSNAWRHPTVT
jgi:hypothetical protein